MFYLTSKHDIWKCRGCRVLDKTQLKYAFLSEKQSDSIQENNFTPVMAFARITGSALQIPSVH